MIIIHHDDGDGVTSANLAFNALNTPMSMPNGVVRFKAINYEAPFPVDLINSGESVIIVDISFNSDTIKVFDEISKITNNIQWIDHHKTSILALEDPENAKYTTIPGIRNDKYCASMLTYLYCFPYDTVGASTDTLEPIWRNEEIDLDDIVGGIPEYLKMVDNFDCWKSTDPDTMNFATYLKTVTDPRNPILQKLYTMFIGASRDDICNEGTCYLQSLCDKGEVINSYLKIINDQSLANNGFEATIECPIKSIPEKIRVLALNADGNSTLFGDKINDYDAVVRFTYNGNTRKYTYSLFSKADGINCREVAEYFHGGGHDHAAGFTSNRLVFSKD